MDGYVPATVTPDMCLYKYSKCSYCDYTTPGRIKFCHASNSGSMPCVDDRILAEAPDTLQIMTIAEGTSPYICLAAYVPGRPNAITCPDCTEDLLTTASSRRARPTTGFRSMVMNRIERLREIRDVLGL